jgi:transcriptional regulator with XRE-family HTH domain
MSVFPDTEKIAQIIGDGIKKKGISIRQVAEAAGVSYSHLSKILRQEVSIPKPSYLDKLAPVLLISFSKLFVSAGYFDNTQKTTSRLEELSQLSWDTESILNSYLTFRGIEIKAFWKDKEDELEARSSWWFTYNAIQNYREQCNLLMSLVEANSVSCEIVDEAFYLFNLVPPEFKEAIYTPNYANRINNIELALTQAVEQFMRHDYKYLEKFWHLYEQEYRQINTKRTAKNGSKQPLIDTTSQLEMDKPENQGFKIFIKTDGRIYGRLDFEIPPHQTNNLFEIVSKMRQIIKDFNQND